MNIHDSSVTPEALATELIVEQFVLAIKDGNEQHAHNALCSLIHWYGNDSKTFLLILAQVTAILDK